MAHERLPRRIAAWLGDYMAVVDTVLQQAGEKTGESLERLFKRPAHFTEIDATIPALCAAMEG